MDITEDKNKEVVGLKRSRFLSAFQLGIRIFKNWKYWQGGKEQLGRINTRATAILVIFCISAKK